MITLEEASNQERDSWHCDKGRWILHHAVKISLGEMKAVDAGRTHTWARGVLWTTRGVTCRLRLLPRPLPATLYRVPPILTSLPGALVALLGTAGSLRCPGESVRRLAGPSLTEEVAAAGRGVLKGLIGCHFRFSRLCWDLGIGWLLRALAACRPGGEARAAPGRSQVVGGLAAVGVRTAATVLAAALMMLALTRLCLPLCTSCRAGAGGGWGLLLAKVACSLVKTVFRCAPLGLMRTSWFGRCLPYFGRLTCEASVALGSGNVERCAAAAALASPLVPAAEAVSGLTVAWQPLVLVLSLES